MALLLQLDIGKDGWHQITLYPDGETLRPALTFCEPHPIESWTCAQLLQWAETANAENFADAERQFMVAATGRVPKLLVT